MRKPLLQIILPFAIALCLTFGIARPSIAHWADLAVADVTIAADTTQLLLTLPTGLIASNDDDQNGSLSAPEIQRHQTDLETLLRQKIELQNSDGQIGTLTVAPTDAASSSLPNRPSSHTSLRLLYRWNRPITGVKMRYSLFEPGVPTARCFVTITQPATSPQATSPQATSLQATSSTTPLNTAIFSPDNQTIILSGADAFGKGAIDWSKGFWVTLMGAFVWGAAHATSPGHGKTLVGSYLIGERATAQHALFLGLTTTMTHTLGVFTLGGFMLLAAQSVVPEKILPWLSLLSGLMVVLIGGNLFRDRLSQVLKKSEAHSEHDHDHHHHDHDPDHHHHDAHHHSHHHHDHHHHHHGGHSHSHLPPEGGDVSWRSLFALGVSGGLIPCPSALVLLLSAIAMGQAAYGMLLVVSFSLGLAVVLTGLGLLLIYSKHLFVKIPIQRWDRFTGVVRVVPTVTALLITLIGIGISVQALSQIKVVPL
jgi:nickel/cobalt transporter (NicO) family protein